MKPKSTLFVVFLLLTSCSMNESTKNYDLQGHRGARGLMPENTIPGFLHAVDQGIDTVEFDVVVTGDNQILVSHEPWFNHVISSKPDGSPVSEEEERNLNIFEMTFEETQQYDVGRRGNVNFPDQKPVETTKPLMSEAILAVETYVEDQGMDPLYYNIETKSQPGWYGMYSPLPEDFAQLLYDKLVSLDVIERVIIQSFDPATLIAMRKIDPQVRLAMLVYEEFQSVERMSEVLGFVPDIWSPDFKLVTPQLVDKTKRMGIELIPWTVNESDEMVRLLEMGVDGIITDYPNRAP